MSLMQIALCHRLDNSSKHNDHHLPVGNKPFQLNNYTIGVIAALGELTLGQPLDRLKIGKQVGATYYKTIKMTVGFRAWYAGHVPSIINRCFIYLPGIQYSSLKYNTIIQPWLVYAAGSPLPVSQAIIKPFVISGLVSPYVSLFESLKLVQQLGADKVYPSSITSYIRGPGTYQILSGVIKSGNVGILFSGFWPTFLREAAFISGMCGVQPLVSYYLSVHCNPETSRVIGSVVASFICQTISQPFDVLKTRREYMPAVGWSEVINKLIGDIKKSKNGVREVLFSGWVPRCLRGVWTFYSMSAIRDWLS